MFFVEPVAGAIIGKIWEERRLIAGFSRDFFDLISKGRLKIFVFGCAGTGKSTFGKILDGQDDVGAVTGSYTLSSETEYYGLKDKRFVQILIPPGQEIYHQRNWGQLFNALQDSSRAIVINLVCWGFHSLEKDELPRIPEFSAGITDKTRITFLENRRNLEIETLQKIVQPFSNFQRPLHMVTLVTKQDLWWKDRHAVQSHYENGNYSQGIQTVYRAKGEANFTHHFCSVSFGQINFNTADRHQIFETSAGYDNATLTANFGSFLNLLKQISQ
jgi:hypothetical protein